VSNLSLLYGRQGQYKEAVKENQLALELNQKLSNEFPSVPDYRQRLAWEHVNGGLWYSRMRSWKEAEQRYLQARTLLEPLAADYPAELDYAGDVGWRDLNLAVLFIAQGRSTEALERCESAEQRFREIGRQKPGAATLRGADVRIGAYRARALAQQGRYADALAEAERCGVKPSKDWFAYHLVCAYALLSNDKLAAPERARISETHASRAIELLASIDWKKAGWLLEPLKTDKDLDPLRERPDFIALVKRAEEDSVKQAGK
jgi:tetratricopeptide (TPR) repeat protein